MAHAHRWVDAGGGTKRCSVKNCQAMHHTHQPVLDARGREVCSGCGAYLGCLNPGQPSGEANLESDLMKVVQWVPKSRRGLRPQQAKQSDGRSPRRSGRRGSR